MLRCNVALRCSGLSPFPCKPFIICRLTFTASCSTPACALRRIRAGCSVALTVAICLQFACPSVSSLRIRSTAVVKSLFYRGAYKFLARPGRKQANVCQNGMNFLWRLALQKKNWWKLASRCCWNRARPWRASELVFLLIGLRTYQYKYLCIQLLHCSIVLKTNYRS